MDRVLALTRLTRLPREFFAQRSPELAKALLGMVLVHRAPDGRAGGVIVEVEAYRRDDPASHAFRGKTARNAAMFGRAGHAYVYFTYGMHWCVNVVAGLEEGAGEAVLLRAIEPTIGVTHMIRRRRLADVRNLARGPGRLTQALAITKAHDAADLVRGPLGIYRPEERLRRRYRRIASGPRIGITKATEVPWRFSVIGNRFVSR